MKKIKLLIAMTFIGLASTNFTACSKSDDNPTKPEKQEVVKTEEWKMNHVELSANGKTTELPSNKCEDDYIEFYSNNTNKIITYDDEDDCKKYVKENVVKIEGNKIQFVFKNLEFSGTFKKYDKEVEVAVPIQELAKHDGINSDPEFQQMLPMLIAANAEIIIFYDRK